MKISEESIEIFTEYPHGNKNREERFNDIKNDLKINIKPPLEKKGLEFTKNLNLKEKIILDAGFGSGTKSIRLAVLGKAKRVIGVDGSKKAIENANYFTKKLKLKNVIFINDKMENLNKVLEAQKLDKKINIIVNYQNLHHVTNWKEMLKIFYNLLQKNGILICNIADPTSGFSQFMLRNKLCYYLGKTPSSRAKIGKFLFGFLEKKKNISNIDELDFYVDRFGSFYHWIFPNQIITEMRKVGFKVCETFPHTKLEDWLEANKNTSRYNMIQKCIKLFAGSKYLFIFLMRFRQFVFGEDTRTYYAIKK